MRLRTLNPNLANAFDQADDAGAVLFDQVFWYSIDLLDEGSKALVDAQPQLSDLRQRNFPDLADYKDLPDQLDEIYFDAEDDGDDDKARTHFKIARVAAAILARAEESYSEAAYEVLMSCDDPEKAAQDSLKFI